jgi:zinc protease
MTLIVVMGMMAPAGAAMPEVEKTSVSGVPVWYVEDNTLPIVHLVLTFEGAGWASDPAAREGRAQIAAEALTRGAGEMSSFAFHRALQGHAIRFSVQAERDDLTVSIHTLKEQLPHAAHLLRLALTAPRFDAGEMAKLQAEQLASIRLREESPGALAARAFARAYFGDHPYGRDGMGTVESVSQLGDADAKAWAARYLTRVNMQVAAAGDIDAGELEDVLEPLVEHLPDAFFPERDLPGSVKPEGRIVRVPHGGPQSVVVFGGPGIARGDKDYYAAYLMNHILGSGSLSSRLMAEVRGKAGLVYGIGTGLSHGDAGDVIMGRFSTQNATVEEAITAVKQTVQALAQKGVSKTECEAAKREVIDRLAVELDSTSKLAQMVAMMMRQDLGRDYLQEREQLLQTVPCDAIQQAAQRWLATDGWVWAVVGGGEL